jgi:proline iminopeptidase
VEYFVKELAEVVKFLNFKKINLFGHYWGTMLAVDYLLTNPTEIKSVIFASPCISVPLWEKTTARYLDELPDNLGNLIRTYERENNIQAPKYKAAKHLYHTTHENRIDPEPPNAKASAAGFGKEVYHYMWGPNEYTVNGTLGTYDRSGKLNQIKLPALFTCGKYDGASPDAVTCYQSQLPGSELRVFQNSSHMPHLEDETDYINTLRKFLKEQD